MTNHHKSYPYTGLSSGGHESRFSHGFADAGMLAVCLTTLTFLALAVISRPHELANRAVCSANVRGIIQSMVIYAQTNGNIFPLVMPPLKGHYENSPGNPRHGMGAPARVMRALYAPQGKPKSGKVGANQPLAFFKRGSRGLHEGSPLACLWVMVLENQITPKSFICPSDPIANQPSDQYVQNGNALPTCYSNFGYIGGKFGKPGQGESYSIAFPWAGDNPAPWWNANDGSDVAVVSDMAPALDKNEKGKMQWAYRDPTQPLNRVAQKSIFNSGNHGGAGQNVGFGDDHVSFEVSPYVGQNQDNIFTFASPHKRHPLLGGGKVPAIGKSVKCPTVPAATPPYDIVMVPVRNVATGAW